MCAYEPIRKGLIVLLTMTTALGARAVERADAPSTGATDEELVGIVDAAFLTALRAPTPWPGYDMASSPLLVYRVGRWSILLNPPASPVPEGWIPYPESWPTLPVPAWLDPDGDPGLVGQLSFDHAVPGASVAAIPLYEDLGGGGGAPLLFAFVVHEAFHRFQRTRFHDVDVPSEERYPTLDPENNALAVLEFLALRGALGELAGGDEPRARESARLAVAVHQVRTEGLDEEARAIERGKEVVEGTAKYVESRFVATIAELCRSGALPRRAPCGAFEGLRAAEWLEADFERRLSGGAIAPGDMARNRIYPTAATVAFLLDRYEPGWKAAVAREGTSRGLFDHLAAALGPLESERRELVEQARERYGWAALLEASRASVATYLAGFEEALASFEDQGGTELSVRVPTTGVGRSRSSRAERWVVDSGRRTLGRFVVYALRRPPTLELLMEDVTVLDEVLEPGVRRARVHVPTRPELTVDGERLPPTFEGSRSFASLGLAGEGVRLAASCPGSLTVEPSGLVVDLVPPREQDD